MQYNTVLGVLCLAIRRSDPQTTNYAHPKPQSQRFCRKPCSKTTAFNYTNEIFPVFNIYFPRSLCTDLLVHLFHVLLLVRGLALYSVRQYTTHPLPEPPPFYDKQLCQKLKPECMFQVIFFATRRQDDEISSCVDKARMRIRISVLG